LATQTKPFGPSLYQQCPQPTLVIARVIRSGEFWPIGSLFSLGRVLKNTKVGQSFGPLFPAVKVMH
jgi:hypothetical protein